MEEGPEPHELIEQTVEHHHHAYEQHAEGQRPTMLTLSAITAAVLAVCAAVGALLSGHAANMAILYQSQATDQWAYFQAKSTKGHIYEGDKAVVRSLAKLQGIKPEQIETELKSFQDEADRYKREKKGIEDKAKELESQSKHEFHKHHNFALGIAAFQVGIVLASISILVRLRVLYAMSVLAGAVGLVFLLIGLLTPEPKPAEETASRLRPGVGIASPQTAARCS